MRERAVLQDSPTGRLLVGIFVVVALAGFAWLLVVQQAGPDTYELVAAFDALGNIDTSTKVKLRGFDIGQVERIVFRPMPPPGEPHFLVYLGIETQYPVPSGAVAQIRGSGLVGEASVHLDVSAATGGVLAPGARIPGRSDPGMKSLVDKAREAAGRLSQAGASIRDADLGGKFRRIGDHVARIADDMDRVSASADSLLLTSRQVVAGVEPSLQRSLDRLDASMTRLGLTLARADTLVAATSQDVQGAVHALRQVVERLDAVLARVDSLALRKQGQLDSTLTDLHAAAAAVRQISEHPWRLVTGQDKPVPGDRVAP